MFANETKTKRKYKQTKSCIVLISAYIEKVIHSRKRKETSLTKQKLPGNIKVFKSARAFYNYILKVKLEERNR